MVVPCDILQLLAYRKSKRLIKKLEIGLKILNSRYFEAVFGI